MSATNLQDVSIAVVDIFAGDVDGAEVVVEVYGRRVAVSVFSGTSPQQHAVEDRLISLLNLASTVDDDTEYDAAINDILDVLEAAGILYPETPNFQLKTVDGTPDLLPIRPSEAHADLGHPGCDAGVNFDIDDALPQYSSEDVLIQEVIVRGGSLVSRVLVNEQDVMLCKAGETGLFDQKLRRELEALRKVEDARAHFVSRGYVKHAELGCVIGLLREWIQSGLEPPLDQLDSTYIGSIPSERRQNWIAQIRQTVNRLHEIGPVWGDGKIDSVIVDRDDNAWLIDFGGGWIPD